MFLYPYAKLVIPEVRQRREFGPEALAALADSVARIGLMHPIVVCPEGDGRWRLVAGERRLRAVRDCHELGQTPRCNNRAMPDGEIACVTLGELTLTAQHEAELEENIQRVDLTWQERAAAIDSLHRLRGIQASKADRPHTFADTADELLKQGSDLAPGSVLASVRDSVLVARHFDNPEVAKAKTLPDAMKVIRRQADREKNEGLAALVGSTFSNSQHVLINGDCHKVLSTLTDRFDVVVTDPPYGIGADEFGDSGGRTPGAHRYADDDDAFDRFLESLPAITKVCKPQAHIYIFCDVDRFWEIKAGLLGQGWKPFRTPLVMFRRGQGRVPLPSHGPSRQYELVAYAFRGDKPVRAIYPDIIEVPEHEANLGHAAQKPAQVYVNLLRRSVSPGDQVLDPYAGSGPIFPAAAELLCYATGIEVDPAAYGVALKRIAGLPR